MKAMKFMNIMKDDADGAHAPNNKKHRSWIPHLHSIAPSPDGGSNWEGTWDEAAARNMVHELLSTDATVQRRAAMTYLSPKASWHDNLFVVKGRENILSIYRLFVLTGTVRGVQFDDIMVHPEIIVANLTLHYAPALLPFWVIKAPVVCLFNIAAAPDDEDTEPGQIVAQHVHRSFYGYIWSIPLVGTFYESWFKPTWGWVASTALAAFMPTFNWLEHAGMCDGRKHDISALLSQD